MANATHTTLLSQRITNAYGNRYTVSLIHRTAGMVAAGSIGTMQGEAWLVRVVFDGQSTFHGRQFADKLDALDDYNARVGTNIAVECHRA